MNTPFRLAAIDLDGTLLGPDKRIHPDNAAAVRCLVSQGIEVVLASGRRFENILRYQRELGLVGPMVACQGGDVRDVRHQTVFQEFVPPSLVLDVIQFARGQDATIIAYALEGTWVERRDAFVELYELRAGTTVELQRDLMVSQGERIFKLILSDTPERVVSLAAAVRERFGSGLQTVSTAPESVEVLPPGVHKARGMAMLAARRGLARERVMAFGDGDNDVELLQWAGLGVAMSDCTPAAEAAATMRAPGGDAATSLARAVAGLNWR